MTDRSVDINYEIEKGECMSPKLIDKEERKKEIALVALDLFAEKGFETTSISEVAKAAGIGKGTIYEYFSSKEELILAAFMTWVEQMMGPEVEEMLLSVDDPEQRLRLLVQGMMEAFISDERVIKLTALMFQLMLNDMALLENEQVNRMLRGLRKFLYDILLEGIARGVFKPEIARDIKRITINLFAYLDGIAFHYFINKNEFDLMEQVNFYLDRLLNDLRKPE
jgi:AcrR family transcriptional regulator